MIVPHEYGNLALAPAGERSDVGVRAHAAVAHRLEAQGAGARNSYAIAAHLAEHAKDVEHGLGDAVRRQIPEPLEVPLPLEFKRPGDSAHKMHALQVGQLIGARDLLCGVARVHGAVAIAILRMRADRARRAPLRVGFADHDGDALQLGE